MNRRRLVLLAAAALAATALALALASCGGDDDSAGPASVVPADAPIYFESVVNLTSDDAEGLNDALGTLLGTDDPVADAIAMIESELEAEGAPVSYDDDIEPLLGDRAGIFLTSLGAPDVTTDPVDPTEIPETTVPDDDGQGAVIVETSDEDSAQEKIDELIADSGDDYTEASHGGVDYRLDSASDSAVAVFDGYVVAGTESGVQDAIDASAGDSLADSEEYEAELESAPDDPVMLAYVDIAATLDAAEQAGDIDAAERAIYDESLGGALDVPALATVSAESDSFTFDLSAGVSDPENRLAAGESELLTGLPGDSWAATAIPDVGAAIQAGFDQVEASAGEGADIGGEFSSATGFDIFDLISALGDVAVFARGTSLFDAGAGIVVEDLDPEATARQLDVLRRKAEREGDADVGPLDIEGEGFSIQPPDIPGQINVVQRDGRLVIAFGDEATEEAFAPTASLGDSDAFSSAQDALGDDYAVSLFFDLAPALELAESAGASDDPGYVEAQPYLERIDYFVTGTLAEDDRDRVRIVLGLAD